MSAVVSIQTLVKPKTETRLYRRHQYTLTFCPENLPHERWMWDFSYTRTYRMRGYARSFEAAEKIVKIEIEGKDLHK